MNIKYPKRCACCNMGEVQSLYETCEICGWIFDPEQEAEPSILIGKNKTSLEAYRAEFIAGYGMCFCAE